MELISKEDVLNILNDICNHALAVYDKKYHLPIRTITLTATEDIKALPNRPQSNWIAYAEYDTPIMLRCSICTHSVVWGSVAKYCPNCGARMEN